MSLLETLIKVSEKAANIARICRQEKHLFELLVQEKGNKESNPRFVQDFKTLADVLIQETVKYDIGKQFPDLQNHVKGEEDNTFSNTLDETIYVEIQEDVEGTANLLKKVLNGDEKAAKLLATEVHKDISIDDVNASNDNIPEAFELDCTNLAIWIDPIDSTAEYINGREDVSENDIHINGLGCVTVLIGVFDKTTGEPLMGIINQPFFKLTENKWKGQCYWGVTTSSMKITSLDSSTCSTLSNIICLSGSESNNIKEKLRAKAFKIVEASGAGYKILTVITGQADAYILSKNTTFKWDTCGPQAILKALGGNIVQYEKVLIELWQPVDYKCSNKDKAESKIEKYCNIGGIVAYKNKDICIEILNAL